MVSFASDYIAGARPEILEALMKTNMEALPGYGTDEHCSRAKELIRRAVMATCAGGNGAVPLSGLCMNQAVPASGASGSKEVAASDADNDKALDVDRCAHIDVEFIAGGTQTNQIVISTMLRDWEGVLAADTGHVTTHEAGAIEYSGHKVIPLPQTAGRIKASTVDSYIAGFYADENHEHEVFPGMVYISYPTEWGTLYTKDELEEIHSVCQKYNIPLYIDGARLAYGLASPACDLTLHDLASLCDVFYIGGTKCGALCGEAIIFTHNNKPEHFMNAVKKRGALLAKGRLLGVQFETLFSTHSEQESLGAFAPFLSCPELEDAPKLSCSGWVQTLYMEVGRHGIDMAEKLEKILRDKGCEFYMESPTNQKFVIMEDKQLEKLRGKIEYGFWEKPDDAHTVVRFATSWSTTERDLAALEKVL